jgi:hypothetical protein
MPIKAIFRDNDGVQVFFPDIEKLVDIPDES